MHAVHDSGANSRKEINKVKHTLSRRDADCIDSHLGLNHTNAFSFENASFSIRFHLATTLQRSKTEAFVFGNEDI